MDENVFKQKIQRACLEPIPLEELIRKVVLRSQAVHMGAKAQKILETATVANLEELVSRAIIGQLAAVADLPLGVSPEQLARQLEQQPAFVSALRSGNVIGRIKSGELIRQVLWNELTEQLPSSQNVRKVNGPCIR